MDLSHPNLPLLPGRRSRFRHSVPPGLPISFQRPVVEYKNEDEYGRLIKPCLCRGGMRYVHELCLRRARTESQREGSLWKCHQCGYQFSFNRLTLQKYLGSKPVSGALTVVVMILVMFLLGFIADPILNLYTDPYDTIMRHEDLWERVEVKQVKVVSSGWGQHFIKGLVSMGVLSFARSMLLNPFHWINLRNSGFFGGGRASGRSTTGRDRALNVSWVMIAFGVITAFYLFYKWVQAIISRYLQRIGNNIVDTQLPGDDDDLKPLEISSLRRVILTSFVPNLHKQTTAEMGKSSRHPLLHQTPIFSTPNPYPPTRMCRLRTLSPENKQTHPCRNQSRQRLIRRKRYLSKEAWLEAGSPLLTALLLVMRMLKGGHSVGYNDVSL